MSPSSTVLANLATAAPTQAAAHSLQAADNALFNGDYATAQQRYSAALTDPQLKCDALFGLGAVDLRSQQLPDAETAFTLDIQNCPSPFRAYLLRGDAHRLLKENEQAVADYQAALKLQPGLIDSYIYERMASISGDDGLKYLRLAAEAPRAPLTALDLNKRLLQIYQALNDTPDIIQQYQAILAHADSHDDLANADVGLATIELANHDEISAYPRLQEAITKYPETSSAFSALVTLVSDGQPVDLVVRTRINIQNENYSPVIGRVSNYLTATPVDKAPAELYVLLGKAYRGLNQFDDAIATFQKVQKLYPKDPMASTAALELAETYVQEKDPGALNAYLAVATAYPASPEAPEALSRAANSELAAGKTDHGIMLFQQLAKQYPNSDQAAPGLFQAAMLRVVPDPAQAAALFGQMNNAQGFLWQGKLLQQLHDVAGARKAWQAAAAKDPGTYFSLRASDLLDNFAPYQTPASIKCCDNPDADRADAEKWIGSVFMLPAVSADLPADLANNPFLVRGVELWRLGWWQEASDEFDALHTTIHDNPLALYQLAVYYKNLRVYRSSIISATRLLNISNLPHSVAPPYLARLAYPIYYADLLLQAAKANKLNPLYVASLIRTESTFNASIASSADARGLMQIVPATGQEVADQLKLTDFSADDLYRPTVNIMLGTAYLRGIKDGLNNDAGAALVAYDAGPTYAQGLLQESGGDFDRFYQAVDVDEPRQYIEFTYQTYAMYRQLYGTSVF